MNRAFLPVAVLVFSACTARIQHGLDEGQANELQAVLLESGFDARKVPEGGKKPSWAIELPEDQATSATRVLNELGLPRPRLQGFGGLEMGLVATPTQERAAHLNALSEELARTLESVSGVTVARVHLVVPQAARPGQPPGQAKASTFLRVRPGYAARVQGMEEELRRLVAGSVEGLAAQDVSLVVSEVVSTVARPGPSSHGLMARLRYLVIGLSSLVSLLAMGLVYLALRLRTVAAAALPPSASDRPVPPAQARPVVNAAGTRRAA
jgi:type III secretion protein J